MLHYQRIFLLSKWLVCQEVRSVQIFCRGSRNFSSSSVHRPSSKTFTSIPLNGIYPPVTTPFDRNENIAWEKFKHNLEKWDSVPFRGYVVLGSTGEVVSLSDEERVEVVKFVKETASSQKLIIAGSGCESTKSTVALTEKFSKVGADAALVVSPCFYKRQMSDDDALYAHYSKVADSSPIPVILYNVPANTSIDLTPSLITRLADHPNIIGLKDSGGDITKIGYVIHKTQGKDFQVLAGSAGFLYPSLCVGCVGGILALANVLGSPLCDLLTLFNDGKHNEARSLQHRLIGPNLAVTKRFGIPGVKKAMELFGYYGGSTRSPLPSLSQSDVEALTSDFKANGFL